VDSLLVERRLEDDPNQHYAKDDQVTSQIPNFVRKESVMKGNRSAIDEMKHAEKLTGRVLFLEGIPVVSRPLDMCRT
jgi:bacterioferritin (cytochrome b1)